MTATFGKLQGCTLELKDGLNIIHAPNETGKSTWCAFLLSMLYGINSRERDKAGFIADKNRYAPWSGVAMSGRLDCRVDGQNLTLTRTTRRQTSPMGEFQAVYTGTGNSASSLTGQNCGEALLGVSREVFERSAFIRQAGLPISQDTGLERRIASLITSGEEDTSYSEASDILKKQLNRRWHNKTGRLPTLEAELADTLRQISELESLEQQLVDLRTQTDLLSDREKELAAELAEHDAWEGFQRQAALRDAKVMAKQAEKELADIQKHLLEDRIPENETIGRLRGALVNLETTRKAVEKARAERDEAAKALFRANATVNETPFAGKTADAAWEAATSVSDSKPWPLSELLPSLFLGAFALLCSVASLFGHDSYWLTDAIFYGIPGGIAAILIPILKNRKWKKERSAFLNKHRVSSASELRELAVTYGERLKVRDTAQAELDKRSAAAESLYASVSSNEQAILLEIRRFAPAAFDVSSADALLRQCAQRRKELAEAETAAQKARLRRDLLAQQTPAQFFSEALPTPRRQRDAVAQEQQTVLSSLSASRSAVDRLTGQLESIGDGVALRSAAEHLHQEIADTEAEYSAIKLAMETLEQANTAIQNRFSPALGHRAAEIFSELTGGRYSGVALDRAFHLTAEPTGDAVYRDAALLSAGTADQLYLAVRLAICDMVLPQERTVPIILDDALANFDDERCITALQWLKKEASHRQILLFTCHSREGDFFRNDKEVFVQQLTDAI